jgi:SAM-dependent methyltransferase
MMRSMTTSEGDPWTTGDSYEPYIGRWSRLVARELVAWLAAPENSRWIDVGCGTGALTETIVERTQPNLVNAVDASAAYIEVARRKLGSESRVRLHVADACALPLEASSHEFAVSGLVLNFVDEPLRMAQELARVVVPDGIVAAYVWDYAGEMQLIRRFWDAAVDLDPGARDRDEGRRFPICAPDPLAACWRDAGLHAVEVRAIEVPTRFRDFDDYWSPFLGGQGPAPGYAMSLDEARRAALRDRLRATLPIANDGSIRLSARAWAVRGRTVRP